jgi:ArsR family transcriptional regulator
MRDREICVCYFVEILKQPQPKISRHLAYLRRAGLVQARREGKWMHYRLEVAQHSLVSPMLQALFKSLAANPQMHSDLQRLGTACCEPQRFASLQNAPRPQSA